MGDWDLDIYVSVIGIVNFLLMRDKINIFKIFKCEELSDFNYIECYVIIYKRGYSFLVDIVKVVKFFLFLFLGIILIVGILDREI